MLRAARPQRAARFAWFVVVALLAPASGWAEGAAWRDQWRKALALYKKKQFAAACPLFASVAQAQPKNGAVWGDLGLCELKRGTPESAAASVHASRLAVRFGDERVRKSAYYNLGLAAVTESLPSDGCTTLSAPSEAECTRSAVVCSKSWRTSGTVFQQTGSVAFFGRSQEDAERQRDAFPELDPSADAFQGGIALFESSENSCASWCDRNAWQSDDSSLIMKQGLACTEKTRGPLAGPPDPCVSDGKRCDHMLDCVQVVLGHVNDSPPVAREWRRLRQNCERQCTANAGLNSSAAPTCSVVHVDPCRGYVGVVCSEPNQTGSGSKLSASEFELPEQEPSAG